MKILNIINQHATQDGDGVNISRIADFSSLKLDPYLMIDEIKSGNKEDYVGGFPEHPHRGIDTFTYMVEGGFTHQDQLGNKETIQAGGVQWMSTGSGVMHSEMPVLGENNKIHGFQIWLNMPAKDKMRPAIYQDAKHQELPVLDNKQGALLKLLAGTWSFAEQQAVSPLIQLSGDGAIADLSLQANAQAELDLAHFTQVLVMVYQGSLDLPCPIKAGQLAIVDSQRLFQCQASSEGARMLILTGNKINQKIVHMGPFVMNTQAEIEQTIRDYQSGKFGRIA
ncbi:pirin family protein [Psychromonas sp. KJ10-10]|uniref:pirin family protein n=1 Tax=Psychromonas sp. KJ10-10 TaxID=3391823 RepID=UPI0039B44046